MLRVIGEIAIKPLNQATSVYFPKTFLIPQGAAVLYKPESIRRQRVLFVDKDSKAKTYPITEHNRARWATVPSTWLRAVSAKPGDVLVVYEDFSEPGTLVLEFKRVMPL